MTTKKDTTAAALLRTALDGLDSEQDRMTVSGHAEIVRLVTRAIEELTR